MDKAPKHIVIIGAGAIGIEFAYFYNTFGSKVTIIEAQPNILPNEDIDVSKELEKIFKTKKIDILTNSKVENITKPSVCPIATALPNALIGNFPTFI